MRILLLNPPYETAVVREGRCQHQAAIWDTVYPPLTLATCAAILRSAHDVRIVDAVASGLDRRAVKATAAAFAPDLVLASISTPTADDDLATLRELKALTGTRTGAFGVHATYFARELVGGGAVDVVIHHEPEGAAKELTRKPLDEVGGVTRRVNGSAVTSPPAQEYDPEDLPFPAWDLLDMTRYRLPVRRTPYVLMTTGQGCPFPCTFCVAPYYSGVRFRPRPVADVLAEMKHVRSFVRDVFFHTDTFTLNRKYVLELCQRLVEADLGIDWVCNSRVDTLDEEMARAMRRAGCWLLSFGIESGSQAVLDASKKRIRLEQSRRAVAVASEAGLMVAGHFILGLPGESVETIHETIAFATSLDLSFAEFYIATPFPGAELYEVFRQSTGAPPADWTRFEYSHNVLAPALDLEAHQRQAYVRFYLRPSQMFRLLRQFGLARLPQLAASGLRFLSSTVR
jgi:anaerobic magnesium-protoporphyrin IX monomethyl ester cyclase